MKSTFFQFTHFVLVYVQLGFSRNVEATRIINLAGIGGNGMYVQFNPQICPPICGRQKQYLDEEFYNMLQLVSTRFAGVAISSASINRDLDFQLNAANREHPLSFFHPLDLMINIDIHFPWNVNRQLERTWRFVEEENEKFPGTFTMIAFKQFQPKYSILRKHWDNLKYALLKKFESSNDSMINLAVYVDVARCNAFKDEFYSLGSMVDTVIVEISASNYYLEKEEIELTLRNQLSKWNKCKKNLTSKYPGIEVMIAVSCSSLANHAIINSSMYDNVAACWETLDKWAKEKNAHVVFSQGFATQDDPFGGWWTLKPDRIENEIITAGSFEETFSSLVGVSSDNADKDGDGRPYEDIWFFPSGFIIFLLLILLVLYFIDFVSSSPRRELMYESDESSTLETTF